MYNHVTYKIVLNKILLYANLCVKLSSAIILAYL